MRATIFFVVLFTFVKCAPMNMDEMKFFLEDVGLTNGKTSTELSEIETEDAIKQFQEDNDIPKTGKLDDKVEEFMSGPRCGKAYMKEKKVNFKSNPWRKSNITYKFKNYPRNNLQKLQAINEVKKAFRAWSAKIPVTFFLYKTGKVDIDITFEPASAGDGPGNTIAYAYFPRIGDIHYDEENWTINSTRGIDFFLTSVHEIGHSLGLDHSDRRQSIMYPYIQKYKSRFQLHDSDVRNIQRLYGRSTTLTAENVEICPTENVDAVFSLSENIIYIIKDEYCWKYKDKILENSYPKTIESEWGLKTLVNAAYFQDETIYFVTNDKIYYYKNEHLKYMDIPYQTVIYGASFIYENRLYYFAGSEYWKYEKKGDNLTLQKGYPKSISSFWKGVPDFLDGALNYNDEFFYFFKNDIVYKFNMFNKNKDAISEKMSDFLKCEKPLN